MSTSTPNNRLRVSVVQTCTAAYSLEDTLEKLRKLTHIAKERDGSQFAVFPEGFIGGYPKFSTFGAVVGERSLAGRDEFLRYHKAAIELSPTSHALNFIEQVSKETDVFLVVGVIERDLGTLYCTAIFIDPREGYVGKHRKLMPTAAERVIWGQGDGSTLPVLEREFPPAGELSGTIKVKMSATICWENYMPLLRYHYYSLGTQLYCVPTVDARPNWQHTMAHIALEGRCFVLSACQFAKESDFPPDHAVADATIDRDPGRVMINGGSVIIGPLGNILAGPSREPEVVLTAEVDLDDCIRGKFDLDATGHYSRSDIFSFTAKT